MPDRATVIGKSAHADTGHESRNGASGTRPAFNAMLRSNSPIDFIVPAFESMGPAKIDLSEKCF